jgi:hypothetical protein
MSICMHQVGCLLTDLHGMWHWELRCKTVEKMKIVVKIGQKYRALWILYLSTCHCSQRHKLAIKALLCNTEYYYIVDSGMYLNNTHRICCCFYTATVVTRTPHAVTSCVRCLYWYIIYPRNFLDFSQLCTLCHKYFGIFPLYFRDCLSVRCFHLIIWHSLPVSCDAAWFAPFLNTSKLAVLWCACLAGF